MARAYNVVDADGHKTRPSELFQRNAASTAWLTHDAGPGPPKAAPAS